MCVNLALTVIRTGLYQCYRNRPVSKIRLGSHSVSYIVAYPIWPLRQSSNSYDLHLTFFHPPLSHSRAIRGNNLISTGTGGNLLYRRPVEDTKGREGSRTSGLFDVKDCPHRWLCWALFLLYFFYFLSRRHARSVTWKTLTLRHCLSYPAEATASVWLWMWNVLVILNEANELIMWHYLALLPWHL